MRFDGVVVVVKAIVRVVFAVLEFVRVVLVFHNFCCHGRNRAHRRLVVDMVIVYEPLYLQREAWRDKANARGLAGGRLSGHLGGMLGGRLGLVGGLVGGCVGGLVGSLKASQAHQNLNPNLVKFGISKP